MGDALATISLMSQLAVAGSTSFGSGYILGAAPADDVVKAATSNTVTKTGNCFVAGTEILTDR